MTSYDTVATEDRGRIRVITLNKPDVLNAIDEQVMDEVAAAVEAASGEVGGIVLTGAGKAFAAGADISAMAEMTPDQALAFSQKGHKLANLLGSVPVPTIAAVNGFALGGGCELALACDFIYASEKARFGQPEVKLAVIPGFGGTQRMTRRVGLARSLELCMTGDIIRADEALRIGLVNAVVAPDELVDKAVETAGRIAEMGPVAIAKVKAVLHRGAQMPLDAANELEANTFAELFATADQSEGMAAFLAKRPAKFQGA